MAILALILGLCLTAAMAVDPPDIPYPPDSCSSIPDGSVFDIIVVGGGSAGNVIARRLVEVKSLDILLIEAGEDPISDVELPLNVGSTLSETTSWNINNAPSKYACLGMNGGQCKYQRNRALGGCSDNNFLIYCRGNKQDFDGWEAMGNPGWSYKECLKYFKKSEDFIAYNISTSQGEDTVSQEYHGKRGLLTVNRFQLDPSTDTLREAIYKAGAKIGLKKNIDYNGESQIGLTDYQVTVDSDFFRENTAKAFLVGAPRNLKICKNSLVDKLISANQRVLGVRFNCGNKTKNVLARKEVVLSAGAINSPGIMERSGIGNTELLNKLGIPVVKHLPGVGQNLKDHFLLFGNLYKITLQPTGPPNELSTLITSFGGFFDSTSKSLNGSKPDIQIIYTLAPQSASGEVPNFTKFINLRPDLAEEYAKACRESTTVTFAPAVLNPDSSGSVHINSTDPKAKPHVIISNLSTQKERDTMLRGVRIMEQILRSKELKIFAPEYVPLKECSNNFEIYSNEYYYCMMELVASTLYHPVGTCSMGPLTNPMAVVDHQLRVHGMDNLWIADASIMPDITRGNTNAPTIMIAERCAVFIKAKHEFL